MLSLPAFLGPSPTVGVAAAGFDGAPMQRQLAGFNLSIQEQDNWCWAAVAQCVLRLLRGSAVAQDEIASEHMRRTGRTFICKLPPRRSETFNLPCGTPCQGSCNDIHFLRLVLQEQGCLRRDIPGAPDFDLIRSEIDAGRPLPCRVQWQPIGGHFVIVAGWMIGADQVARVRVFDPKPKEGTDIAFDRTMTHRDFISRYTRSGRIGTINFSYQVG
jgi:hypothetical protein